MSEIPLDDNLFIDGIVKTIQEARHSTINDSDFKALVISLVGHLFTHTQRVGLQKLGANRKATEKRRENPTVETITEYHYHGIKDRGGRTTKVYKDIECRISKGEFKAWVKENWNEYLEIHKVWASAGFPKGLAPTVDRIDSKQHYQKDNIRFLSFSENASRSNLGKARPTPSCTLSLTEVIEIKKALRDTDISMSALGRKYGVVAATISSIKTGRTYRYVKI